MKFIVGYKQEMTQQYREDGTVVPVTVVKADPAFVTQVKTADKDGYQAIQIGIGSRNKAGKSLAGHLAPITKTGVKPFHRLREIRLEDSSGFSLGDTITVETFTAGDKVAVTGTSKGKGFQGVVKRHGFSGGPASHGHKDQLRMPGSIGSQDPQRVFKGMKMGGRMGGDRVTVKNLEIVYIDPENNLLYVKGALPGARNSLILIMGEGELQKGPSIFEVKEEKSVSDSAQAAPDKGEVKSEEASAADEAPAENTEEAEAKDKSKE